MPILQIAEPIVQEQKPKIGIKPLQFLTGCFNYHLHINWQINFEVWISCSQNVHFTIFVIFVNFVNIITADPEAVAKSEMSDDCVGKMKIDDLIIIPNNINHAEEGGSALQVIKSS